MKQIVYNIVFLRQSVQQFVTSIAGDSVQRLQETWHRIFNNLSFFSFRTIGMEIQREIVEGGDVRKVERTT
jgi:hypothetical protein